MTKTEMRVIPMDEYRPHINIQTSDAIHVYPVRYFEDFIKGVDVVPIQDDVLRVIVREWLEVVKIETPNAKLR